MIVCARCGATKVPQTGSRTSLTAGVRPLLRVVASNKRPVQSVRFRNSFSNRKFVTRDQGLRYFRVR